MRKNTSQLNIELSNESLTLIGHSVHCCLMNDCIWQARIKKIMQADEDVGKIALAVPVLVCKQTLQIVQSCLMSYFVHLRNTIANVSSTLIPAKALELFLQDLCDRTYEITLQRGAKTMNSLHL